MIDTKALRSRILDLAIQGKLTEQLESDGTAEELYQQIQAEKKKLVKEGKIKKENPLPEIKPEEVPFEIPRNWKWVRLGEIFTLQAGKFISASQISDKQDSEHQYKCFGGNGIRGYVSAFNTNGTHALIGRQGALCGNVNLAHGIFYATEHAVVVYQYCNTDVNWIFYELTELNLNQYATSVAQPGLAVSKIEKVLIPLSPLAEQKRIVSRVEEIFRLLDSIDEAQKQYAMDVESLKAKLITAGIQGKLTEQLDSDGTAEELYQQIQEEKQRLIKEGKIKKEKPLPEIKPEEVPFEIPGNWKWVRLGGVSINIQYGTSKKSAKEGIIPVLRMGNLQNGKIIYDNLVYTSDDDEINQYLLSNNDLLFNRTNSIEIVGKTAIYKAEMPAIYAGYLIRITPMINSDYLNYVMQSQYYWRYCESVRSDSIGQSNINAEKLKNFPVLLPPLAEQKRIVEKLDAVLGALS